MPDIEMNQLRFEELQGGAALEELNAAIDRCVQDIADPNTVGECQRVVTLKLTIKPDKYLKSAHLEVAVNTKLGQTEPTEAIVFLVQRRGGRLMAVENNPDQLGLNFEEPATGPVPVAEGGK